LIVLFHLAHRLADALARVGRTLALSLLLVACIAGCRHKPPAFAIPHGAQVPIAIEEPPSPDPPLMIAEVPAPELAPLPPPPLPPPTPRKRPVPAPKEEPPVQAAEAAPAVLAIGTLSTGGDPTPQSQHLAQDIISSIQRRISALSAKAAESQKKQVRQVRHFLDQAQQALNSGDAEGAENLATKARLLMDDLEKK
jgi:type IV secretory pathway VirB10-like protein